MSGNGLIHLIPLLKNVKSVMFSCYATKVSFFVFHSLIRHMLSYIWVLFVCFLVNFCNINVLDIKPENCGKVKQNGRNMRSILYFSWRRELALIYFENQNKSFV